MKDVFLIVPEHAAILNEESRTLHDKSSLWDLWVRSIVQFIPFGVLAFALYLFAFFLLRLSFQTSIPLSLLISAGFVIFGALSIARIQINREKSTEQQGVLVTGEFESAEVKHVWTAQGKKPMLEVRFSFITTGGRTRGKQLVPMSRLDVNNLPPRGTKMAVLYASDTKSRAL